MGFWRPNLADFTNQVLPGAAGAHLGDIKALLPNAGGHQGVECPSPEVCQDLLLLSLLHAHARTFARCLSNEDPAIKKSDELYLPDTCSSYCQVTVG